MLEIEKSIQIERPLQEVFDFISDPANDAKWQASTEFAEWTSEGPPGVGSTIRQGGKFLGREMTGTGEVTAWDPPNHIGVRSLTGPVPFESTTTLESRENGTLLTVKTRAEPGGFFKLAGGLLRRQLLKQLDEDFETLKKMMEAG